MSKGPIKLRIPEPCHEDWNKMTPKDQGAFCNSCSKVVVDFTKMSDRQLLGYLQQSKDQKTCGRFSSFQLNRSLIASEPAPSYYRQLRKMFFGFILSLGLPNFSHAQNKTTMLSSSIDLGDENEVSKQIFGRVQDSEGNALVGVTVRVYLNGRITEYFSITDENGLFSLRFLEKKLNKNAELRVSAKGFAPVNIALLSDEFLEVVLYDNQLVVGKMKIEEIDVPCMGDVDIEFEKEENLNEDLDFSFPKEISGLVLDENGKPVSFATIRVEGAEQITTSDIDGYFKLELDESQRQQESIKLSCSSLFYIDREFFLSSADIREGEDFTIYLNSEDYNGFILGEIIVDPEQEIDLKEQNEPGWKEKGFKSRRENLHYLKMNPE